MSRTVKIILGIVGGLMVICCAAGGIVFYFADSIIENTVGGAVLESPEDVSAVGQSISDYSLPPGFEEAGGMELLGVKMVMINGGGAFISIMEFPEALAGNEAQMEAQMEQQFAQQGVNANVNFEVVDTREVVINGETRILTILEGEDENGVLQRMGRALFEAENGNPAMLMMMGSADNWQEEAINSFLGSLE